MYSTDEDDSPDELNTLNISNDEFYRTFGQKKLKSKHQNNEYDIPQYGSKTIRHSLAAYDLWRPFYPTSVSCENFKNFHRPKLRHYKVGPQVIPRNKKTKTFPVKNLTKTICNHQKKLRCKIIKAIKSGLTREEIINRYFCIQNSKDLTSKHGELFLFEYCEEYPPVLSQNGMCSNVKTLIRSQTEPTNSKLPKKVPPESDPTDNNESQNKSNLFPIGQERIISNLNTTKQTYYNQMKSGSRMQVIENNLYRAPIFLHQMPSSDFLVIRTRNGLYIRSLDNIFTVGQTMPLVAIPEPTDHSINRFRSDFSNRYIHKLFMESKTDPPSIRIEELLKLFSDCQRRMMRRRLTNNGTKTDVHNNSRIYRGHSKYGLQSLRDYRSTFTPEQYCLNMAMLAARQRLYELNYTESMILPPKDSELEVEVQAAPWNTSSAVIKAHSGKNYLDFKNHLIDPTGPQREGFSCIAWSRSPTEDQQNKEKTSERSSSTPDSIHDSSINNGNQKQPVLMKNPLADKIRREKLERLAVYQREAQRISEMQSRVLSSNEQLSSDEDIEESDEENLLDSSFDEQLNDLSKMIIEGQTLNELTFEKEEEEREKMMKEFDGSQKKNKSIRPDQIDSDPINVSSFKNKILKITRVNKSDAGVVESIEIIREPKVIALYVKNKLPPKPDQNKSTPSRTINHNFEDLNRTLPDSGDSNKRICLNSPVSQLDGSKLKIFLNVLNTSSDRTRRAQTRCQQV